jgi:CubicO group peptidase (beta-lactamase class C family)
MTKRWRGLGGGVAAGWLCAVMVWAAPQQPPVPIVAERLPQAAIPELDRVIDAGRAAARIPGLSVAIAFRGEVVYSRAFGLADLEHQAPATPRTAFRTASTAKPLTATAVMQLVEQGRIDLDAPIQKYCPAFPEKQWPVTARELLGHLAGVRHYQRSGESTGKQHFFTIADALALFGKDALLHEPGTKYLYSTYGYSVLGCAIEGASGQTYETYMRDRVFRPAGMTRTRVDRIYEIVPERARGYQLLTEEGHRQLPAPLQAIAKPNEIYNADLHDTSMKVPGGGLLSTAEDLARFTIAVRARTLLPAATIEQMWTDGRTRDGTPTGYGLGWGVTPAQDGIRRLTHSGNQAGAASVFHMLPEAELGYAIMTNLEDAELGPISRGIAEVLRPHLMRRK